MTTAPWNANNEVDDWSTGDITPIKGPEAPVGLKLSTATASGSIRG